MGWSLAILVASLLLAIYARAQTYTIDWFTIDGGGGTSTGGVYSLSGTIGQPDAGGPMAGGPYSITGGFWVLPTAVQTTNAPLLEIAWTNTAGGDWHSATNWNPNQVPGALEKAIISVPATVTVSSPAVCFGLTLGSLSSSPTLTGGGTLTLYGPSAWVNGTMSGSGRTVVEASGSLNVAVPSLAILVARTLENGGSALFNGAGILGVAGGAVITNRAGALFRIENENSFGLGGGGANGRFDNAGTFRKSAGTGTATVAGGLVFNNSGAVEIQTGTLSLAGGGTNSGSVDVPAGTTLNLSGGTHTGTGSSSITGAGQLTISGGTATLAGLVNVSGSNTFSGGTANLNGNYICTNNTMTISGIGTANFNGPGAVAPAVLSFSDGTLGGSSTVTVTAQMHWSGGTMSGSGRTIISAGVTLNASIPSFVLLITRSLENAGTILFVGTGIFGVAGGAVITNRPGALFLVENENNFGLGGGGANGRFDNAGTFRKTAGTGTTTVASGLTFNNLGAVQIQTGALSCNGSFNNHGAVSLSPGTTNKFAGGGSATGSFIAPATTLLEWTAGTFTLNPGAQLNGQGLYKMTGGNVVADGNVTVENLDLVHGSSTLNGTGVVTVGREMNWTAGTMDGSGRTIIPPGAALNIANPGFLLLQRTLENGGNTLWSGSGTIGFLNGVITNRPGGLFIAQNSATLFFAGGACRFDNNGTFRKSLSNGTLMIANGISFNNSGTVDIRSGILAANGGYVSSSNALLNCALGGTTAGTNHGQLQVAGTVTLNGALSVDLINGFSPATSDSFTVLTAGTRSGAFSNFLYPSNVVTMQLSNSPTAIIVRVTDILTSIP